MDSVIHKGIQDEHECFHGVQDQDQGLEEKQDSARRFAVTGDFEILQGTDHYHAGNDEVREDDNWEGVVQNGTNTFWVLCPCHDCWYD